MTALDHINFVSHPTIIKIDVEGYERSVIKGADSLFRNKNVNVIIMEVFDDTQLTELLSEYGFIRYGYDVKKKKLLKTSLYNENNGIFIKDVSLVKKRLKKKLVL